jgi:hypothetical protein
MKGTMEKMSSRPVAMGLASLAIVLAMFGCGESGEDGAERLANQEELRAAREEGARDARQSARIAELERKLKDAGSRVSGSARKAAPADPVTPVTAEEPLVGLWKGEAVIRYDDGGSDPFNQTIKIDSLVSGAISGYSEARQGSTTCHGPLTYEGVSEGWYRFSAEERNVDECIDYSEVQLMLDSSEGLAYRETTEVSVSTGRLERVR